MPYIIAILIVVVAGVGFTLFRTSAPSDTAPTVSEATSTNAAVAINNGTSEEVQVPSTTQTQSPDSATSAYKDGTYLSEVTYLTPIRKEYKLDVELSVKDGIVTGAEVTYSQGAEKDPNAQRFEAAYRTEVIGKSLESINLSRVGGASLTTGAFNKALAEIKVDSAA